VGVYRLLSESPRPRLRPKDHRHTVVQLGAQLIERRSDNRDAAHPFAGRRAPILPYASQSHQPPVRQRDRIALLTHRGLLPPAKVIDEHEATAPLERLSESRSFLDPLGFGVDVAEADVDVLGPVWDQAPAQEI